MTDYRTHCAWCHKELEGRYITFIPSYDHMLDQSLDETEIAMRYCSSKCATARRSELFHRRKLYALGGRERWPRFTTEVPPELAAMLDLAMKRQLGVNLGAFSRAKIVRAALRMWLDQTLPIPEPSIEGSADEIIELEINGGGQDGT